MDPTGRPCFSLLDPIDAILRDVKGYVDEYLILL